MTEDDVGYVDCYGIQLDEMAKVVHWTVFNIGFDFEFCNEYVVDQ